VNGRGALLNIPPQSNHLNLFFDWFSSGATFRAFKMQCKETRFIYSFDGFSGKKNRTKADHAGGDEIFYILPQESLKNFRH
jgi:hypothetical protein